MRTSTIKYDLFPTERNRLFYDNIAANYDAILDEDAANEIIRKKVEEKFTSIVKTGWVLDFGGGSGRDIEWLKKKYKIFFCEPSEGMRQKAIDRYKDLTPADNLVFLEGDKTNFINWHINPPFDIKIEAMLADFAVINCIADINLLFKNMAELIRPGGHFIALILNKNYKKQWKWKVREAIRSFFSPTPLFINTQYGKHKQSVYIYTQAELVKAAQANFDFCSREPLYEFTLFHFIKK